MKKYDLAIFDVDGTLLDTTEGVLSAVAYTIKQSGLKPLSASEMMSFIGPPIQDSMQRIYGIEGEPLQALATIFRNRYKDYDLLKAAPYEGIYEVMTALKLAQVEIAVATYKRQDYAAQILSHFGFDKYSKLLYGADHENKLKKKDIIELAIAASGVQDRKRMVMIGDSAHDAIGAKIAGVDFLAVTYGFGFKSGEDMQEFCPIGIADTPREITAYIANQEIQE